VVGAQGGGQTHPQWVPGVTRPPHGSKEGVAETRAGNLTGDMQTRYEHDT
jgi:hypothetical protein